MASGLRELTAYGGAHGNHPHLLTHMQAEVRALASARPEREARSRKIGWRFPSVGRLGATHHARA